MPLQATSGAASYDAFGGGVPFVPTYIEEVFSTWLYTGNDSTQTINNGIDLAGKGGLVWAKARNIAGNHYLVDTARGAPYGIRSSTTGAQTTSSSTEDVTAFNSNGFSLGVGNNSSINNSGEPTVSWTFRKAPKFFDVVTWTGTGGSRAISHALNSTPGCIIIKRTDSSDAWYVVHRSLPNGFSDYLTLNTTNASVGGSDVSSVGSSTFTVSNYYNGSGSTWVAYIFAHNAGGFGLTGTDNVISCGSFTTNGSSSATVNLGYEPQWVLIKSIDNADSWFILDNMRGWVTGGNDARLLPNSANAEATGSNYGNITATGFVADGAYYANSTHIYIAIRRGPMKTPTSGTQVYGALARTGTSANATLTAGFPVDATLIKSRSATYRYSFSNRLVGAGYDLNTAGTNAEFSTSTIGVTGYDSNTGIAIATGNYINDSTQTFINYFFRRAPGFFDEVCWTGDSTNPRSISHNLTVAPTLIITKKRNSTSNWITGFDFASTTYKYFNLNDSGAATSDTYASSPVYGGNPTSSVFIVGNQGNMNISGDTYVSYLFASCPGVSKVGSYTGNGSSQTINMGFTGGARFFLVKRTDSTGDWWVYDSARGIVSAADPALRLNSTAAEVTSADAVDTDSTGLIVNQESTCNINVSSATYIYLGIS